jgi:hypothetical protein
MITASTLSLEEYQRHDGLQVVEKCKEFDFCRKVKSSKRFKKGSDENCHCLFRCKSPAFWLGDLEIRQNLKF